MLKNLDSEPKASCPRLTAETDEVFRENSFSRKTEEVFRFEGIAFEPIKIPRHISVKDFLAEKLGHRARHAREEPKAPRCKRGDLFKEFILSKNRRVCTEKGEALFTKIPF